MVAETNSAALTFDRMWQTTRCDGVMFDCTELSKHVVRYKPLKKSNWVSNGICGL